MTPDEIRFYEIIMKIQSLCQIGDELDVCSSFGQVMESTYDLIGDFKRELGEQLVQKHIISKDQK